MRMFSFRLAECLKDDVMFDTSWMVNKIKLSFRLVTDYVSIK